MITVFDTMATIFEPSHIVYPDTIILQLKAKHFSGVYYDNNVNGLFPKAIREHDKFVTFYINDSGDSCVIGSELYLHESYTREMFNIDRMIAMELNYNRHPESIVRTVILTKTL